MQEIIVFFTNNPSTLGYIWLTLSVILLLIEIGTPGFFYFISLAIGCALASIFAFFEWTAYVQCLIALGASIPGFFLLKKLTYKKVTLSNEQKTNIDALIGQEALVIQAIEPRRPGRIKIKGEEWPAISLHSTMFHQGSVVTIVKIEGNKLVVM